MKVNKMFNIDSELVEKLKKEGNQSKIVNELIKNYFLEDVSKEELEKQRVVIKEEILRLGKKLEKIEKELNDWENNKLKGMVWRVV